MRAKASVRKVANIGMGWAAGASCCRQYLGQGGQRRFPAQRQRRSRVAVLGDGVHRKSVWFGLYKRSVRMRNSDPERAEFTGKSLSSAKELRRATPCPKPPRAGVTNRSPRQKAGRSENCAATFSWAGGGRLRVETGWTAEATKFASRVLNTGGPLGGWVDGSVWATAPGTTGPLRHFGECAFES